MPPCPCRPSGKVYISIPLPHLHYHSKNLPPTGVDRRCRMQICPLTPGGRFCDGRRKRLPHFFCNLGPHSLRSTPNCWRKGFMMLRSAKGGSYRPQNICNMPQIRLIPLNYCTAAHPRVGFESARRTVPSPPNAFPTAGNLPGSGAQTCERCCPTPHPRHAQAQTTSWGRADSACPRARLRADSVWRHRHNSPADACSIVHV